MNLDQIDDIPDILMEFLEYHSTVRGHSDQTVAAYYLDLKILFRFLKRRRHLVSRDIPFSEIDITDIDIDFIKTIRIEENGKIKESISFPAFRFTDIVEQDWETCDLREELETTKYMFFVFKKEKDDYIFKGIKLWNMPELDIETSVMEMWKKTYNTINSGNIVRYIKDGKRKTNFVGMSENEVCHVRPHGRDAQDTFKLPVADKVTGATEYTKQCFWINSSYIIEIFKEFID